MRPEDQASPVGCRRPSLRRVIRLALLVLLTSANAPVEAAAQWKDKWAATCAVGPGGPCEVPDPSTKPDANTNAVAAQAWDHRRRYTTAAGYYVQELTKAGRWLANLGFAPPCLTDRPENDPDAYLLTVTDAYKNVTTRDQSTGEVRVITDSVTIAEFRFSAAEKSCRIWINTLAAISPPDNMRPGMEALDALSPVHELFHAVQRAERGSAEAYAAIADPDALEWIVEGTAEAVLHQYGGSFPKRDYTTPLTDAEWGQESHHFWLSAGRTMRSPANIGWFKTLLQREDLPNEGGVPAVSAVIHAEAGSALEEYKGLHGMLPHVVARYANHIDYYRQPGDANDKIMRERLGPTAPQRKSVDGNAEPLAVAAYEVLVQVPAGETYGLAIELAEEFRNHEWLHLIVDGMRLDERQDLDGSRRRNIFRTTVSVTDTFLVRVVNVSRVAQAKLSGGHTIELTLSKADLCTGAGMMSAVSPAFREFHDDIPPDAEALVGSQFLDERNPLLRWERYESELLATGGLMPAEGEIRMTGLVDDGGVVCTDPVGDNFMLESELGTMSQQDLQNAVMNRMQRMTPQEQREMMQSTNPQNAADPSRVGAMQKAMGFAIPTLPASVMKDLQGSAMFELYSPNGVSWTYGSVLDPSETRPIYEHGGIGRWKQNSAAQVWIVLPGTKVSSLAAGKTYPAALPAAETGNPFYVRTDGVWQHRDTRVFQCKWMNPQEGFRPVGPAERDYKSRFPDAFQGNIMVAETGKLTGTLTVERITGGQIEATFTLSGRAAAAIREYEFVYSDNLQDRCEFGSATRLVRSNRTDTAQQEGQITITGRLTAPASVEVSRLGRRVGWTRTVRTP